MGIRKEIMLKKLKNILKPVIEKYRVNRKLRRLRDPIFVDGFPESKNFGDALNLFLTKYLSGKDVFPSRLLGQTRWRDETSYAVIGSVCQMSRSQSVVWGAGFIDEYVAAGKFVYPTKVVAVRGPLTRKVYHGKGVDCPACYGDPALLLPLIHNPEIVPQYDFGVVPHYVDWDAPWVAEHRGRNDVLIINIMISDDHELFVKQLKSCRRIVTSSLHGLILAHAYGVPVCAVKLSEGVTGGDFKFNDYLLSVGRQVSERRDLYKESVAIEALDYDHGPISVDLAPLIEACPFILLEQKEYLLRRNKTYYRS